ncbi:dispanin subfamily A member 2b [Xenopus laevis]|uniref:Uncharacterized protein n=2 Tax=Xenopus laevis TaxID=8355 RepID=A0A974D0C0_XENLA|nr:dispanin subfamily A member 2b [Xenopus laevis]OCT81836.1 hypothetical protein XELAEV_18024343mg [Xenopus laevis]
MENKEQEQPITQFEKTPRSYGTRGYEPVENTTYGQAQANAVTIEMSDLEGVRDHLAWSIFNMVYMNIFCLGLVALVFSTKSQDQKLLGDRDRAKRYGSFAQAVNIAAFVLSSIAYIAVLVVLVINLPKK